MAVGLGVGVAVAVAEGSSVLVGVAVAVGARVGVAVKVGSRVGVGLGKAVVAMGVGRFAAAFSPVFVVRQAASKSHNKSQKKRKARGLRRNP